MLNFAHIYSLKFYYIFKPTILHSSQKIIQIKNSIEKSQPGSVSQMIKATANSRDTVLKVYYFKDKVPNW